MSTLKACSLAAMATKYTIADALTHVHALKDILTQLNGTSVPINGVANIKIDDDEADSQSVGTVNANANDKAQELLAKGKRLTQKDLDNKSVKNTDLKAVCKSLGLTQTGKKEELIAKILAKV